jgi:hypothetical protein
VAWSRIRAGSGQSGLVVDSEGGERPSVAAEDQRLEDDDDSTPSSGFGVIVLLGSHSTYYGTEVWAGATVASSRMHNAVAESRDQAAQGAAANLGDDVKSFDRSCNTTPTQQHNTTTTTTTPQHHNTTTPQHHNRTPSHQDLVSKGLHHLDPPMLLLVLALTVGLGSRLNCDSLGQLGGQQQASARAFHNSARAIHNSARAIHNLARAFHKNIPENSRT